MADTRAPKIPRTDRLDDIDLRILAALENNGRITNSALARAAGIAESTCVQRVRGLRASGVITGFRTDIDPEALGLGIQAVITVRLATHSRDAVRDFQTRLRGIPNTLTIFHVAGADDYLVHVAVDSAAALRDLVLDHLQVHPGVLHTETRLVFDVIEGAGLLSR